MEYVRREDFRTWVSEVGSLYGIVIVFVTIAALVGSLASYVSSGELHVEARRSPTEYLGPEGHVVPSAYP